MFQWKERERSIYKKYKAERMGRKKLVNLVQYLVGNIVESIDDEE